MKKLFLSILLTISCLLGAINIADPTSVIYLDYQNWKDFGAIKKLPAIIPFGLQEHKELLAEVIASDNVSSEERTKAKIYLEEISKPSMINVTGAVQARGQGSIQYGETGAFVDGQNWFSDDLTLYLRLGAFVRDPLGKDVFPYSTANFINDTFEDEADATIMGNPYDLRSHFLNTVSYTKGDFTLQTGISRITLGPTYDTSPILSADASHRPYLNVSWDTEKMRIHTLYQELTATDYFGNKAYGDKRMYLQNYSFYPFDFLEFSVYQSTVMGGRFDLTYFVPFSFLFYNQAFSGFSDNSLLGGAFTVKLPKGINWHSTAQVDDAHLNKLIRLDFGGKTKMAWENELSWTPLKKFLSKVRLNYTMVTPYMYTHQDSRFDDVPRDSDLAAKYDTTEDLNGDGIDGDETDDYINYMNQVLSGPNYQNYTHDGRSLGSQLLPNSDQIALIIELEPVRDLRINLKGAFGRHGDPREGMDALYSFAFSPSGTGGTLWDDGYSDSAEQTFKDDLGFLTQSVLELTLQGGIQASYVYDLGIMEIAADGGYTIQQTVNPDFVKGNEELKHYWALSLSLQKSF